MVDRSTARRVRGMVTATISLATVLWLSEPGAVFAAAPAHPHAPAPAASPGPAVTGVRAVPPRFAPPTPDPARRNYVPQAVHWPTSATDALDVQVPGGTDSHGPKAHGSTTPLWARARSHRDGPRHQVALRVVGRTETAAAGIDGVLFTAAATDRTDAELTVGLDYAAFAEAYGGNFGARLRLVLLPACVLTTPELAACRVGAPLPGSANDLAARTVSADVTLAASGQPMVLAALSADPGAGGGPGGTYAATDLKPSGAWSGGGSAGGFSYLYPITVPPAASGLVPDVALTYSSSAVDGQTASTQSQASWAGDGWSGPAAFVEQAFTACSESPEGSAAPVSTPDQCFDGPIMTMSLNGVASTLVRDDATGTWRTSPDTGDVITHVMNSGNGSGTHDTDYWVITQRDGTVYQFGRNRLPGWTSGKSATNSVDTVPVFSAHSPNGTTFTDPCYNATWSQSWCTMAYRWHLDYVKDVHGNAMAYYYKQDTNFYGFNKGASMKSYVRDSYLDHVDYGFTDGNAYATPPNQVLFSTGDRCVTGTCQPLNATNKANWPDVPYDALCASGSICDMQAPSFFSTVRLTTIAARQWSGSAYTPVDSYALSHTIPPTGDGTSPTLWLSSITRTGSDTGGNGPSAPITLPSVSFTGVQLQNRVDTSSDGLPAFYRYRIKTITTEAGSVQTIDYDKPNPCTAPVSTTPASNTSSCFPVRWSPPGYTTPKLDWFHKYAVVKITSSDPTGGSPPVVTSYRYEGGAAWHFDDNELVKAKYRSYGQFRGYGDVKTYVGDGVNSPRTMTESTFYRGMSKNNSTTVVQLTDSASGTHEDRNELAGMELERTQYVGENGAVDSSTITSYWVSDARATRARSGLPDLTSAWVAPVQAYTRQAVTGSGPTTWRYTERDTSYDAVTTSATFGLPKFVYEHTVPAVAAYDRCTRTVYATANTSANLVGLAREVEVDSVACGSFTQGSPASVPGSVNALSAPTVSRPAQVVSDKITFYDDASWSTTFPQAGTPGKGDVTMEREAVGYSGGFTYQTTARSKYDSIGRVLEDYDGAGNKTATAYTDNAVGLTTGVTTTNALLQPSSVTVNPRRGLNLTETDLNGVVTTRRYDTLGRATGIWLASRSTSIPANYTFAYTVANNGVTAVTTQKLNDTSGYQTSTTIMDASLRVRQTQAMTPQGGRLVTDTFYDSRNWVSSTYNGWWDPATTPNTTLVSAAALGSAVPDADVYTYDGLGRVVVDTKQNAGVVASKTTFVHNGDRTTVIAPTGGVTRATVLDPVGQVTRLEEYTAAPTVHVPTDTFTGTWYVTGGSVTALAYGYDGHGNKATVTDAHSNVWTSTFDLLGRVTGSTSPDTGSVTNVLYDGAGNLTQKTDGRGRTISYTYDALGRKTGLYAATVAAQAPANRLSAWVYDNSDNAVAGMTYPKGHLTTSVSYSGGAAYTAQQSNFNVFGSSLGVTVTVPSTEGALGTSYTFSRIYTATTGLLLKEILPAAGGLPAETVLHGYAGVFDLPNNLGGLTGYAQGTTYDAWGRVNQETIGAAPNLAYVTNGYDAHTGRLTDRLVTRAVATPTTVDDQAYAYDAAGNITRQVSTRLGSSATSETQCYAYDGQDRLTGAWTATDACAVAPTPAAHAMVADNLGTSSAYWTTWSIDDLGNRTSQVQHNLSGGADTTTSYSYFPTRPHALSGTTGGAGGTTSYTFDNAGLLATRNAGQGNQVLNWDDAGRIQSVTGGAAGPSDFVYDADGQLLLQKDPGKNVLYLPGEQLTLDTSTQAVTGTRYYALPGGGTCVRSGSGSSYQFVLADQHGTPDLYLDSTAQTPTWRQSTPYGEARGTVSAWPDNHGFTNKPLDTATGLTMGERSLDTATGLFVSATAELMSTDTTQLGGYSYCGHNPIRLTCASALYDEPESKVGGTAVAGSTKSNSGTSFGGGGAPELVRQRIVRHYTRTVHRTVRVNRGSPHSAHPSESRCYRPGLGGHGCGGSDGSGGGVHGQNPGNDCTTGPMTPTECGSDGTTTLDTTLLVTKTVTKKETKSFLGLKMFGVCLSGAMAVVVGVVGSKCLMVDSKGVGVTTTQGAGLGPEQAAFLGIGPTWSDGDIDDQGGDFRFVEAGGGAGPSVDGSWAWGYGADGVTPVHTGTLQGGTGLGGGALYGHTITDVDRVSWLTWG